MTHAKEASGEVSPAHSGPHEERKEGARKGKGEAVRSENKGGPDMEVLNHRETGLFLSETGALLGLSRGAM